MMSPSEAEERYRSFWEELARLGAFGEGQVTGHQETLASIHERAKRFVEDTEREAPGPLQILGIASRLLGKWKEAEKSFRKFTELLPDQKDGWLELTWALAMLDRLEEAEQTARVAVEMDPDGSDTLGNLAAVQFQRGKIEEAYKVLEQTLRAAPNDAKNRMIMDLIRQKYPWVIPWRKRIFGR